MSGQRIRSVIVVSGHEDFGVRYAQARPQGHNSGLVSSGLCFLFVRPALLSPVQRPLVSFFLLLNTSLSCDMSVFSLFLPRD